MTNLDVIKDAMRGDRPVVLAPKKEILLSPLGNDSLFFQDSVNATSDTNIPEYFQEDFELVQTELKTDA